MIVLIAGMPRSGSTFSFNIAQDLLSHRGSVLGEYTADLRSALRRAEGYDHAVLKTHGLDDVGYLAHRPDLRVICTTRKLEDAAASWIEAFGYSADRTVAVLQDWLAFYGALGPASLVLPFRRIDWAPWWSAWSIGRFIAPDVTPWEAWAVARRHAKARVKRRADAMRPSDPGTVDMGFSFFDAKTLIHRRHVSARRSRGAEARLDPATLRYVRSALGQQAVAFGLE